MKCMAITNKDVEYAAALSKLELTGEEKCEYTKQLNLILEYVDQLNELDTEGVEPTYHVLPVTNIMREDEVRPSLERDRVLMNGPDIQEACFKVPRIIE